MVRESTAGGRTPEHLARRGSCDPGASSVCNPLKSDAPANESVPSMPPFSLGESCVTGDVIPEEAAPDVKVVRRPLVPGEDVGHSFRTYTMVVLASVMFVGVVVLGLSCFLPVYLIGSRAVLGTVELIEKESVRSVVAIMRSAMLQLPDFAHIISTNYMRSHTSAHAGSAFPNSSRMLLQSLMGVMGSFQGAVSYLKFLHLGGLYGFVMEYPSATGEYSDMVLGGHNNESAITPVYAHDSAALDYSLRQPVVYWNVSWDVTRENGPFNVIVRPWDLHRSKIRWFPEEIAQTGEYFNFVIPFRINGFPGMCEVGLSSRRLLQEAQPLLAALRQHGRIMIFDDMSDVMVLNSWGEHGSRDGGDIDRPMSHNYLLLHDISDPLMIGLVDELENYRNQVTGRLDVPEDVTFPFKNSLVRAAMSRITDENGMDVVLSVVIMQSDFYSGVKRARDITAAIVGAVVVVSAVFALAGTYYLVKPLTQLVEALKQISDLELPAESDPMMSHSRITEVREIQSDYVKLLRQARLLLKFLPEAVLDRNAAGDGPPGGSPPVLPHDRLSEFGEGADLLSVAGERLGDKKGDVRLNCGIFTDKPNVFSSKHCSVVAIEVHRSTTTEATEAYLSNLIATAAEHSGCVEVFESMRALVSFGAHTAVPMHCTKGCRFAFSLYERLSPLHQESVSMVVDTNEFLVGTCGVQSRNARVLFGIDHLFTLTGVMRNAQYHIAATSSAASHIQGYQAIPVDCLMLSDSPLPTTLFELRSAKQNEAHGNVARHFRLGFSAMRQGRYKQAIACYNPVVKLDERARQLMRLCKRRYMRNDTTPYVRVLKDQRCVTSSDDDEATADEPEPESESESMKSKSETETAAKAEAEAEGTAARSESVNEKGNGDGTSQTGSGALFEMYNSSSSSSSEAIQPCADGGVDADDVPLVLQDMNHMVWTRSLKKISEGAFSTVFLGMSDDGVQVAIKFIPRLRRDIAQESLEKEMEVASMLHHPNIVRYVSCSLSTSYLAIIMEYVPGGSLHSVVKKFGKVSALVARRFTIDILNGLNYLHGIGIVHCDVKPHNVLLDTDGVCKLSDFGSTISEAADVARTAGGEMTLRGTALYMAPEVAAGGRCTPQSDIFSLGISLLEMLLGRLPWCWSDKAPERSDSVALCALMNRDVLFVQSLARGYLEVEIPDSIGHEAALFVRACCHPDPAMRPSALELLSYLFVM
ncbi:Protein kinase domain [Trypanosoma vivax]|nr:serine/threonine protein kinase [Trypanosoma vivax]KAH8603399.1 Protein kinase domain [Trypanosoma vivax]KAH8618213.1 Protein kinase domain [Trypanosoma vivax]